MQLGGDEEVACLCCNLRISAVLSCMLVESVAATREKTAAFRPLLLVSRVKCVPMDEKKKV